MRLSAFSCSFLIAAGFSVAALADEAAAIPFSLDYVAALGCPGSEEFEAALHARQPTAHRVPQSETVAQIHVRLVPADSGLESEIWANLPDGTSFRRQVSGASCTEAMASMAIIAAMALEGNHSPSAAREPAPGSPEAQAPEVAAVPAPAPPSAPSSQTVRVPVPAPSAQSSARTLSRWYWSVVAAGGVEGGVAPSLAPAVAAGVEVAQHGASPFAPVLRLSGVFAERGSEPLAGTEAHFRLLAARLDLCPKELTRGRWLATACVEADAGELHGAADGVDNKQDQAMLWLGAGLVVRGSFALSPAVAIDLGAGARALVVHDRFIFNPSKLVYQVPDIAGDLLIGLRFGWR